MVKRLNELNYQQLILNEKYKLNEKKLQRKKKLCELLIIFSLTLMILCLHKYAPKVNLPQRLGTSVINEGAGFSVVEVKNSYLKCVLYQRFQRGTYA